MHQRVVQVLDAALVDRRDADERVERLGRAAADEAQPQRAAALRRSGRGRRGRARARAAAARRGQERRHADAERGRALEQARRATGARRRARGPGRSASSSVGHRVLQMGSWSVASRHTGVPAGVREHAAGTGADRPWAARRAQASIRRVQRTGPFATRSRRGVDRGRRDMRASMADRPTGCQPSQRSAATGITLSPVRAGPARRSPEAGPGMLSYRIRRCNPARPREPSLKGPAVDGTLLASNLGFPEGPVVMPDGSIVFCDGNTGELLRWKDGALGTLRATPAARRGAPCSAPTARSTSPRAATSPAAATRARRRASSA